MGSLGYSFKTKLLQSFKNTSHCFMSLRMLIHWHKRLSSSLVLPLDNFNCIQDLVLLSLPNFFKYPQDQFGAPKICSAPWGTICIAVSTALIRLLNLSYITLHTRLTFLKYRDCHIYLYICVLNLWCILSAQ